MHIRSDPPAGRLGGAQLVLGGTSLIGGFLLSRLVGEGTRVIALTRAPAVLGPAVNRVAGDGVDWRAGDLADPELARRLEPAEVVFSLSPIWLLPDALPALASLGVRRLVAFSSTSRLTKAASPVAAEREVARRLAWGEDETMARADALGMGWTLLRPTLIYAEGRDQNVSRLAGLIRRLGVLPLSGSGEGLRQPVHAADLALAAVAALRTPATLGRIYDLPGGETLTYRAMVERVFESLGRRPRILAVPPALWRLGLTLAAPLLPGATAAMGARMSADLTFDPKPAARDFGWSPRPFRPDFRNLP